MLTSSVTPSPPASPKRPRRDGALRQAAIVSSSTEAVAQWSLQAAQLPTTVFARILTFAVPGFVPAAQCVPLCPNLPIRRFKPIAGVSRAWMLAARGVVQQFVGSTLDWELLAAPTSEDVDDLRYELEQRGEQLLDLRITLDAKLRSRDLAALDWHALLTACPKLQRLDLRGVPLEHRALGQILTAAAAACPAVVALVLPKRSSAAARQSAVNASYEQLADALEQWNVSGKSAVRQLTIPDRAADEAEASSAALLAILASSCPSLEYLDGWKSSYRVDSTVVTCSELWYVSLPVWQQFSNTLGATLCEFNWAVAPLHDAYVRMFATTRKPQLRRLCLTVSETWSWEAFAQTCDNDDDEDDDDDNSGQRVPDELVAPPTVETLCMLAQALPNLEQLDVVLHANVDDPAAIDADAFSDAFLTAVAQACPVLRELKIIVLSANDTDSTYSSDAISGSGLAALSRIATLQDVVITRAGAPLDAFTFIWNGRYATHQQRTLDIGLDQGDDGGHAFYDEALKLLTNIRDAFSDETDTNGNTNGDMNGNGDIESLANDTPERLLPRKFVIKLRNLTTTPDLTHLQRFCKRWNRLVRELAATLPWLQIAAETDGVLEHGPVSAFSTIGYVLVASRDANLGVLNDLQTLLPPAAVPATPRRRRLNRRVDVATAEATPTTPVRKRLELPSSGDEHAHSSSSESDGASSYGSAADGDTASEDSAADSPTKSVVSRDDDDGSDDERSSVADGSDDDDDPTSADDSLEVVAIDSDGDIDSTNANDSLEVVAVDSD